MDTIVLQEAKQFTEEDVIPNFKLVVRRGIFTPKTTLTMESLLNIIQTDDFMFGVIENLQRIYHHKILLYGKIITTLQNNIRKDQAEINLLYDIKHATDNYPMLQTNKIYLTRIQVICHLLTDKVSSLSDNVSNLRAGFIDAICNKEKGLVSLIGRDDIKHQILQQMFLLSKTASFFIDSFLNIVITGGTGTGKTKLAYVLSHVYCNIGILLTNHVTITSPMDFVSKYVGDTGTKTTGVLMHAIEGVLFIDEVYAIADSKERKSHGDEALAEMVNFLDKYMGLSIVIGAGYKKEIDALFFGNNEGLSRRFPYRYNLGAYSASDLTNILIHFIQQKSITSLVIDERFLYTMIFQLHRFNCFSNAAGDMLTLCNFVIQSFYTSSTPNNFQDVMEEAAQLFLSLSGTTFEIK